MRREKCCTGANILALCRHGWNKGNREKMGRETAWLGQHSAPSSVLFIDADASSVRGKEGMRRNKIYV